MTDIELIRDEVKVSLSWIGEGISGDYDPDDPEDRKHLRFDVCKHIQYHGACPPVWEPVDDASYCMNLTDDASGSEKIKAAAVIMEKVYDRVVGDESIKKICEGLSHL